MSDSPVSMTGCGCGKHHLPGKQDTWIDGVLHRYAKPCFSEGPDGERVYFDFKTYQSIGDRIANLERVVADLVKRADQPGG